MDKDLYDRGTHLCNEAANMAYGFLAAMLEAGELDVRGAEAVRKFRALMDEGEGMQARAIIDQDAAA